MIELAYLPLAYLIGTFPTGLLLAKIYNVDITSKGSGNIGATNLARTLGKKAGIITLLVDILKGFTVVYIAKQISLNIEFIFLAAFFAVAGHCFSIPKLLKGGKGVATALGVLIGLNPYYALIGIVSFIAIFYFSRIVSLASVLAVVIVPVFSIFTNISLTSCLILSLISLLIIYRHKENISRLIKNEEKKFSFGKS